MRFRDENKQNLNQSNLHKKGSVNIGQKQICCLLWTNVVGCSQTARLGSFLGYK